MYVCVVYMYGVCVCLYVWGTCVYGVCVWYVSVCMLCVCVVCVYGMFLNVCGVCVHTPSYKCRCKDEYTTSDTGPACHHVIQWFSVMLFPWNMADSLVPEFPGPSVYLPSFSVTTELQSLILYSQLLYRSGDSNSGLCACTASAFILGVISTAP